MEPDYSHERLQSLVLDRLDNVPIFFEHLNVAEAIVQALPCVIESVLPGGFTAVHRANALSFEDFPATLVLPAGVS